MFQSDCDAVVEMLMKESVVSFDIALDKSLTAMTPESLNPRCAYADGASSSVRMSGKRKRDVLDSDDEDEEETAQLTLQA